MMRYLRPIVVATVGLWLIVGLAYPLVMTGVSQIIFPRQANGSVVTVNGRVVGSEHVGQYFNQKAYFWGRPSATNPPDNPLGVGASNLGPTNPKLIGQIRVQIQRLRAADPGLKTSQIPISLVESSGSGIDPDITVDSALIQVARVHRATGISEPRLRDMIHQATKVPLLGFIGVRRVNVLALNLAVYRHLYQR